MTAVLFALSILVHLLGWYVYCSVPLILLAIKSRELNKSYMVLGLLTTLLIDVLLHKQWVIWFSCYISIMASYSIVRWVSPSGQVCLWQAAYVMALSFDLVRSGAAHLAVIRLCVALSISIAIMGVGRMAMHDARS